jgi:hypothetical protein
MGLTSIEIITAPNKTVYGYKQEFDKSGMVV